MFNRNMTPQGMVIMSILYGMTAIFFIWQIIKAFRNREEVIKITRNIWTRHKKGLFGLGISAIIAIGSIWVIPEIMPDYPDYINASSTQIKRLVDDNWLHHYVSDDSYEDTGSADGDQIKDNIFPSAKGNKHHYTKAELYRMKPETRVYTTHGYNNKYNVYQIETFAEFLEYQDYYGHISLGMSLLDLMPSFLILFVIAYAALIYSVSYSDYHPEGKLSAANRIKNKKKVLRSVTVFSYLPLLFFLALVGSPVWGVGYETVTICLLGFCRYKIRDGYKISGYISLVLNSIFLLMYVIILIGNLQMGYWNSPY